MRANALSSACLVTAAITLSACASSSTSLAELSMAKPMAGTPIAAPAPQSGRLLVKRDRGGYTRSGCVHRLSLDGQPFADLAYGEAVLVFPAPGAHILSLTMPQSICNGGGDSEVAVDIKADTQATMRITSTPDGRSFLQPTAF